LNSFLEAALKEAGTILANSVISGLSSAFLTVWTWWLTYNSGLIPGTTLQPPDEPKSKAVIQLLAFQFFWAAFVLMVLSFVIALSWLYLVRFYRPGSPEQAVKFRRYWLALAALLLVCTVAFYGFAMSGVIGSFGLIQKMAPLSKFLLLAALVLSALTSFYLSSALRSPPTVIAAIPFGSYIARLRFR
jgi:hypothetical protein